MNSEEVITKIKTKGYWRIVFEPVEIEELESLPKCKEIIEKNRVQMRGWDYPHFPLRIDDDSRIETGQNFYQGWLNWENHIEFWKMFRSGQFIHYLALREDWTNDLRYRNIWQRDDLIPDAGEVLGVTGTIFQITEIYTFLARLCSNGMYKSGVKVNISLNNTENRYLVLESFDRVGFSTPKRTAAPIIKFDKTYSPEEIIKDANTIAVHVITELFQVFQWENPNIEMIKLDQDRLITGKL